jgi:hypothetical protein
MVEQSTSWLDYVTSIGTLLASLAALAAVGITLYLNVWRERNRQPRLSLLLAREAHTGAGYRRDEDDGPTVLAPVNVTNAPGKRSAHGVQVLLSAGYWLTNLDDKLKFHEQIHQDPITWWISDPHRGEGRETADIGPGMTRKALILFSGHPASVYEALSPGAKWADLEELPRSYLRRQFGVFGLVPLSQDTAHWIDNQLAYEIRLTVVADDVDAVSYKTRLRWDGVPFDEVVESSDQMVVTHPAWDELVKIHPSDWPGSPPADTRGWIGDDSRQSA